MFNRPTISPGTQISRAFMKLCNVYDLHMNIYRFYPLGVTSYNKGSLEFDNGPIIAQANPENTGRGLVPWYT